MTRAMKLVLGGKSSRKACREVFGEKYPNIHRTLGNTFKKHFGISVVSVKNLSETKRKEMQASVDDEGFFLPKPGNPNWQRYLEKDEEELLCSFLTTCNYMHIPFNRQAFKGLVCAIAMANGHANPSASNFYVRQFLARHPNLREFKTANVGHHRAKQATVEVRDAVFQKLQVRASVFVCVSAYAWVCFAFHASVFAAASPSSPPSLSPPRCKRRWLT